MKFLFVEDNLSGQRCSKFLSRYPLESSYLLKSILWSNDVQEKTYVSRFASDLTSQPLDDGNQHEDCGTMCLQV